MTQYSYSCESLLQKVKLIYESTEYSGKQDDKILNDNLLCTDSQCIEDNKKNVLKVTKIFTTAVQAYLRINYKLSFRLKRRELLSKLRRGIR